jgi:predicted dithiol-disulfide oxidoreductase (DUF899 family)
MMNQINSVSREEWLNARKAFLLKEKEFTYAREKLNEERRKLPMVKIEQNYQFDSESGQQSLGDLFGSHQQLIIYHFMFGKDWEEGCPSCSFWADNFNGIDSHLAARNTAFAVTSNAPLQTLTDYKKRLGWSFNWVSATDTQFGADFAVSFYDDGIEKSGYNYSESIPDMEELPGISIFLKHDGDIYHSYSTYARGLDMLNGAYHYLDLTPRGRDESGLPFTQAWVKRHDEYE